MSVEVSELRAFWGGADTTADRTADTTADATVDTTALPTFEDAYPDLWQHAYRVAYRVLGSSPAAEDVAQETLVRASRRWRHIAGRASPWISRVSYRLAIDETRRWQRERRARHAPPAPATALPDERMDLVAALLRLPRRQREVIALRYLADQSQADTAAELGLTVSTVARHAAAGLQALRCHVRISDDTGEV